MVEFQGTLGMYESFKVLVTKLRRRQSRARSSQSDDIIPSHLTYSNSIALWYIKVHFSDFKFIRRVDLSKQWFNRTRNVEGQVGDNRRRRLQTSQHKRASDWWLRWHSLRQSTLGVAGSMPSSVQHPTFLMNNYITTTKEIQTSIWISNQCYVVG